MNKGVLYPIVLFLMLPLLANAVQQQIATPDSASLALVRIDVRERADEISLPVFAHLRGSDDIDYALIIAPLTEIQLSSLSYQILDSDADAGRYFIATRLKRQKQSDAAMALIQSLTVLADDGIQLVVRASEHEASILAQAGFEIAKFPDSPIVWLQASAAMNKQPELMAMGVDAEPAVQAMMGDVTQEKLSAYVGNLSGASAATIGGETYTILTRHTASGTPISKATQYAYEFLQNLGLQVTYQNWSSGSYSGRNVVGTMNGTSLPEEIVLITAHIDDMPSGGNAPGADDNASGSAGVMMAAETMSLHHYQRTIRFILFTGEEQGLLGSLAYANAASASGENIVAVLNLDMISWDSIGGPVARLHTRTTGNPAGYAADKAIADMFIDVVSAYGLSASITPVITPDGISASDHLRFWNKGYPAILAIEDDDNDFCAYYHTANDRLSFINMAYYTSYVKAAVGTAAHLAFPDSISIQDCDFDNDGSADIGVWRPATGIWYTLPSGTPDTWTDTPWGLPSDIAVPGDYDGDMKTDIAVWRPDTGVWYVLPSASPGTFTHTPWGAPDDKPFPGDYDGDGKTDLATWRQDSGNWFVLFSGTLDTYTVTQWGLPTDIPVPGDYDHDGKTDVSVWRPETGTWFVLLSGTPDSYTSTQWGVSTDKPVNGDYDGDGKTDIAVWRPDSGTWFVLLSGTPDSYTSTQWGVSTDIPVLGDYDGDGKSDRAVFRPEDGIWFILPSGSPGTYFSTNWGITSDVPLSALTSVQASAP
jgi:Zn-dependent M28 family amino/carboxypeptidase